MSTISRVAERAGVSRTTVSHVINHADRVSRSLRERVQAAIDELGYAPNPQAQSLRTGRTNIIAMLIPDIRNPFYPELVKTAQSQLEAVGLDTLIFNTDVPGGHSQEHGREYLRQIGRKRVDGLIVGDFALHGMHDASARPRPAHRVHRPSAQPCGRQRQARRFRRRLSDGRISRRGRATGASPTSPARRSSAKRWRAPSASSKGLPSTARRRIRRCASRAATSRRRAARRSAGCWTSTAQICRRRCSSPTI